MPSRPPTPLTINLWKIPRPRSPHRPTSSGRREAAAADPRSAAGRGVRARASAGAVHLDLWGLSLIDTSEAPLRAFMWMIGHLFSLRGVTPDRPVVVYEQDSGMRAARAFWFLEYLGHPNVRVLDGGLQGVARRGAAGDDRDRRARRRASGTARRIPRSLRPGSRSAIGSASPRPRSSTRERRGVLRRGSSREARRGDSRRGALEWKQNLTPDGTFKTPDELRAMYGDAGVTPDREVVTYCQGGYRAAHTYLALRLLGLSARAQLHGLLEGVGRSRGSADRARDALVLVNEVSVFRVPRRYLPSGISVTFTYRDISRYSTAAR